MNDYKEGNSMRVAERIGQFLVIAVVASAVAGASASTFTVATFADPAVDSNAPLFSLVGNQFQGGWSGANLNLLTPGLPGPDVLNAKFTMPALTATLIGTGTWSLTGGVITFTDALNTPVFTIAFDAASLVSNIGFGASDLALQNVTFSDPNGTFLTNERFAFSFANEATTANGTTWTASFTSSAIPEPASIVLLMLTGLLCRRRGRAA